MGKTNEMEQLIEELHNCGENLIYVSQNLLKMFGGNQTDKSTEEIQQDKKESEQPAIEKAEERQVGFEELRSVLAQKSQQGCTSQIRELIQKYGGNKLSDIDESKYGEMLKEVEVM